MTAAAARGSRCRTDAEVSPISINKSRRKMQPKRGEERVLSQRMREYLGRLDLAGGVTMLVFLACHVLSETSKGGAMTIFVRHIQEISTLPNRCRALTFMGLVDTPTAEVPPDAVPKSCPVTPRTSVRHGRPPAAEERGVSSCYTLFGQVWRECVRNHG